MMDIEEDCEGCLKEEHELQEDKKNHLNTRIYSENALN